MDTRNTDNNPTWTVIDDGEPSDAAIGALARLLLAVADADDATPTKKNQLDSEGRPLDPV